MCIWSHQGQGRYNTFIMGHALLKKAILHLKTGIGRIFFRLSVHKSTMSTMSLFQSVRFRTLETGLCNMLRYQTGVFEMGVTVSFGSNKNGIIIT